MESNERWRQRALFSDGGVAVVNPSPIGGSWAWCLVEDGRIVASASGTVRANGELITNNCTEYLAAVNGLEALPAGWSGCLCSDSQVTLGRLFSGWKLNGLEASLVERARAALRRLGHVEPVLLQGHPTKADLERGVGAKRGLPVSAFNRLVDKMCQEAAAGMSQ